MTTTSTANDLLFAWWASETEDSLIYLARNPESGAIKIGRTRNLDKRLADLRTAVPGLQFVCAFRGGPQAEADLHASFEEERIAGEWFRPSQRIADLAIAATRRRQP